MDNKIKALEELLKKYGNQEEFLKYVEKYKHTGLTLKDIKNMKNFNKIS